MSELLAGTVSGVFKLESGGGRQEEGPTGVQFLARGDGVTYAVTEAGALWRRDSKGWRLLNEQPVEDEVWSFNADPRLPGRLYLGVSPALLYRSDDEGETWTGCESLKQMPGYETWTFPPPPHIPHVRSVALDPTVKGGVYIGVEEGGVFRSRDGGDTFESLNEGLYWDVHTVVPAEAGPDLYATTGAGFHYSADSGAHWQHVPLDHRYTVPLLETHGTERSLLTVAAAGPPPTWSGGVKGAVYKSTDGGRTWRRLEKGLPEQIDPMVRTLVEDDGGRIWAALGGRILLSSDVGESWRVQAEDLPDVRSLVAA